MFNPIDKQDTFTDNMFELLKDDIICIGRRDGMTGNWTGLLHDGSLLICYGNDNANYEFRTGLFHEMAHLICAKEDRFHLPEFGLRYPNKGSRVDQDMFSFKLTTFDLGEDKQFDSVDIILSPSGEKEMDVFSVQYLLTEYCFPDNKELLSNVVRIVDLSGSASQGFSDKTKLAVYENMIKHIICNSIRFSLRDILETWHRRIKMIREMKNRPDFQSLADSHRYHATGSGIQFY